MGKYKKKLVEEIIREKNEKRKQDQLREKYHVEEENIMVVETTNVYKFTMNLIASLVRIICSIFIFILAALGLLALIYPAPRIALYDVLMGILNQFNFLISG